MDVSVIHGRALSRLVNRRQGNSGTRNGSRRFHANHAMIMNEIRSILQVFRQGINVQRLTEDVSKLRAAGMVQGTVHLGQVSQ
jgi:division protein CdvB (Snf7/Vps24/ESCRT-III family)